MNTEKKTKEFIERAKVIHGDRYDYSKTKYTGVHDKLLITCREHGAFEQIAHDHLQGKGCPECARERFKKQFATTTEEFIRRAKTTHGNKYDYSKAKYVNSKTKVEIVCPVHGSFWQNPLKHVKGSGCPKCARDNKVSTKTVGKYTRKIFIERARKVWGKRWIYPNNSDWSSSSLIKIICPLHGKFQQRVSDHLAGNVGCAVCRENSNTEKTFASFLAKAKQVHGDKYDYSKVQYTNNKTKVEIVCPIHGSFWQAPFNHLQGYGCPECGADRQANARSTDLKGFEKQARQVHGDKYEYLSYKNKRGMVRLKCPVHGEFEIKASYHLSGGGCPKCHTNSSNGEDELFHWLQTIVDQSKITRRRKDVISPYELDLVVEDQKIAIEFNGSYWHSEKFKAKNYHQNKSLLAMEKGWKLIHVWEYDWVHNRDRVKSLLGAKLKTKITSVGARKCEVKIVSTSEAKSFCEHYHMQGNSNASIKLGLYTKENNELVALMTFGQSRFDQQYNWELIRFCSKGRVVGGASKLWKHFTRNYLKSGDRVLSYARLDWSDGGLYRQLGFKNDGYTKPNYVWARNNEVLKRYRTRKNSLKKLIGESYDPARTEVENMEGLNWTRIWDSGNLRYYYEHG